MTSTLQELLEMERVMIHRPSRMHGTGSLHGQGQKWWKMGCIQNKVGFVILDSKNVHISGLTSMDSRKWHISIERSSFVHASKLNIKAPKDSPSTDGIRIEHSTNVTLASSIIKTGDDCIEIGDGSKYININRIFCGLGHGISCPTHQRCNNHSTAVEISNILYNDLKGTTNSEIAVEILCSESVPCKNIRMKDI
ncbi:hypothetical protein GOBAR_DD23906 [Gossypium barbadense]|nr:hypothetical protein GOBAR_DD23906 [Gossypium barbadense]